MTLHTRLNAEGKKVSLRKVCSTLGVARSTMYYKPVAQRKAIAVDSELQLEICAIIQAYPWCGLRRIRVELYRKLGTWFNRKKIHRIIKRNQ